MKYLYTTQPDEGCHKVKGVYGRPAHSAEQAKLRKSGWVDDINQLKESSDGLREEKEGRQEIQVEDDLADLYEQVIGKRPHHKMKPETIQAKIEEALSDD